MRRTLFKSILGFLFAAALASAGTLCSDTGTIGGNSLDKYIAFGAGCTIGNLQFSNFSYTYTPVTPTGVLYDGTPQPATSVLVSVDNINHALSFGANWIAGETQTSAFTLSFTVAAPSGSITSLYSDFAYVSSGSDNGGPIFSLSANCAGGTCASSTDFTDVTLPITPTSATLTITDTVTMDANGGSTDSYNNFHLSIVKDQYSLTAPPDQAPEPVTYAMTGCGLLAVAAFCRWKKK